MQLFTTQDYLTTNSEGFTKRVLHKAASGVVFVLNFLPGQSLPPHTHEETHLMVHVQSGHGDVIVDDMTHHVGPHTLLICAGKEVFSVKNTGDDVLTLVCVLYPSPGNPAYARDIR